MPYTQENRFIAIETPLGKNELLLTAFRGVEGMSRLFNFDLIALSHNQGIPFEQIVGKSVTISVDLADGSMRYFNGIISKFIQTGSGGQQDKNVYIAEYRATMVPWLWLLTLTENSKIFQGKSVPKIVEEVFNKRGFQAGRDYALRLHGNHDSNKRDYCVQYRESDFNFISRLLEEEGISYFFEHEDGKHTLVLADDPVENKPCPQQKTARYQRTTGSWADEDWIQDFQKKMEVVPTGITLNDYNFKVPLGDLKVNVPNSKKLTDRDCEIYDYPGCYEQRTGGDRLANIRMQEEEARISVFTGVSDCRAFTSGQRFELVDYYRSDMTNKQYVLTQVVHEAMQKMGVSERSGGEANYRNQFTCIPFDVPFRPLQESPRPVIRGTQTAIVVGPSGEEIYTDEHGRVKVQFHWDREGKRDENSSCWIRVAQLWAGPGWGGLYIPRIGQEVVVGFLEGDPDRPIIIGCVYHGNNPPPYPLPDEKTKSTVKSDSSLGGGGFNEIRFEDKKGKEEIYLHGQKDWTILIENNKNQTVGNDETHTVGHDRQKTIVRDETTTVGRHRIETVGGNEVITVALTRTRNVGGNEMVNIGAAQEITVGGARAITVGGAQIENIGVNHSTNVGKTESVKAKKVIIEAEDEITWKTGQATVTMKKSGDITIQGKNINVKGSGNIVLKANKILEN